MFLLKVIPMPAGPVSPEMMVGGILAGGLFFIGLFFLLTMLAQGYFIQVALRWVCQLPATLGSTFVTAICINVVSFLTSILVAMMSDNHAASGGAGLALNIIVGSAVISSRHKIKLMDGLLVELLSIVLSILMTIAAVVVFMIFLMLFFILLRGGA